MPLGGGGVNTGLTQQEKEFQPFIVWIVIGPWYKVGPELGFATRCVGFVVDRKEVREEWRTVGRVQWGAEGGGEDTQGAERI